MDVDAVRLTIVRPALEYIELWSENAEALMIGTGLTESRLKHIKQMGGGPALSLWQMEPATHDDIWVNFLAYRPKLREKVANLLIDSMSKLDNLKYNQVYAVAMARIHYLRDKKPIPSTAIDLAHYHKRVYNTFMGKTDVNKSVVHFETAIRGAEKWKQSSNTSSNQVPTKVLPLSSQDSESTLRLSWLMRFLQRLSVS